MIRSWYKRLFGEQRGVSMMEMGIAAPLLALVLTGIAGFGQGTVENAAVARAVNDSVNVLAVGIIKDNSPSGASGAAINTFLEDTGTDPSKVRLHLLVATMPLTSTTVSVLYEGYGGTLGAPAPQYTVSGGTLHSPHGVPILAGDTVYIVEVWYEHPGALGPLSDMGVAYGQRVVIR